MHQTVRSPRRARVAAMLFVALLASSVYAMSVSGVAVAAANKSVAAQGIGNVDCPTAGTQAARIELWASKFKGGVQGEAYIGNGSGVEKHIYLTAGTINTNSFTLQGIVDYDNCGGVPEPTPVNATISGQCGTDVLVTYTDANGETGSFLSSVACT
jgi:hypothetical protein